MAVKFLTPKDFGGLIMINEQTYESEFNPAADEFAYGEQVYNLKRKQNGVVMDSSGTIVKVRYYDKDTGDLSNFDENTSMQDLVNESSK